VRVVCNNTLQIALRGAQGAVKVPHNTTFDPIAVKQQLGIATSQWAGFLHRIQLMATRKVKIHEASAYFESVFKSTNVNPVSSQSNARAMKRMQELFDGQGRG
jgi:hypothetical protein